jgi:hypothetical protein
MHKAFGKTMGGYNHSVTLITVLPNKKNLKVPPLIEVPVSEDWKPEVHKIEKIDPSKDACQITSDNFFELTVRFY